MFHRLSDGVGTNRVFTGGPQIPLVVCHMLLEVRTFCHILLHFPMTSWPWGVAALLWWPRLSWPRLEAVKCGEVGGIRLQAPSTVMRPARILRIRKLTIAESKCLGGDLSVCPLGGLTGAQECLVSNRRGVPPGVPTGTSTKGTPP